MGRGTRPLVLKYNSSPNPAVFCYTIRMFIQDIIKQKPYLAWYVKDPGQLSDESVLEHVLNYGNWEDVKTYIRIKGSRETAQIFRKTNSKRRTNYLPEVQHYFMRFFQKYAS